MKRIFEHFQKNLHILKPNHRALSVFSLDEEKGLLEWLEKRFVSDLDLAGIEPLVCFKQFGQGKNLNRFQARIRTADRAAIICTEALKKKCRERENAPYGSAIEIQFAENKRGMKN